MNLHGFSSPLTHIAAGLFVLFSFGTLYGQQIPVEEELTKWFYEERFIIADQNMDALLDKQELVSFQEEFVYYLQGRNYELTDRNKDGRLSFREMYARRVSEANFRYKMENRRIIELKARYPQLKTQPVDFLRTSPAIAAELFRNFVWLYSNEETAKALYTEKTWTSKHPDVLVALQRNLRWMVSRPAEARNIYANRQATRALPQLLSWRADHKVFMRKYPTLNPIYGLGFFPEEVRVNYSR
ncbi:MAG: hypothetical protein AAGI38_21470 [Bacteroidota bacterium]